MKDQELIGGTQAATVLGISRQTLLRWIQIGKLTPTQKLPGPNGAYLFNPITVNELAQKRRVVEVEKTL